MPVRQYANAPATTLNASCTNVATSIVVVSTTGLPITFPYTLIIDRGTATEEAVSVTAAAGTTLTVTRGIDSTTAFAHNAGATVVHGITAQDIREANAHVNADSGVHGVVGSLVGTTDVQTLTNKTLTSPVIGGTPTGVGATSVAFTSGSISTNSTSFINVTGLTFSVLAGATYEVHVTLNCQLATDATMHLAVNGPAAPTKFAFAGINSNTGGVSNTRAFWGTGGDVLLIEKMGNNGNGPEHIRGIIIPSVNGTLAARFKKIVGTGSVAIADSSWMLVRRIA